MAQDNFVPEPESEKISDSNWRGFLATIWFLLAKNKWKFLFWNVLLFLAFLWTLAPPLLIGLIVNHLSRPGGIDDLTPVYGYALVLAVGTVVIALLRLGAKQRIAETRVEASYNLRTLAFNNLLNQSLTWHHKAGSGNKVQRVEIGEKAVSQTIKSLSQNIYEMFIQIFFGTFALLFFGWQFFAIALAVVVIVVFLQIQYRQKFQDLYDKRNREDENSSGKYFEGISNISTIKSLGAKSNLAQQIATAEAEKKLVGYRGAKLGTDLWRWFNLISGVGMGLILFVLIGQISSGIVEIGAIVIIIGYYNQMYGAITHTSEIYLDLLDAKTSVGRLKEIISSNPTAIAEKNKLQPFPEDWQSITAKDLNFQYEDGENALKNVNFVIRKGEKIGIAGKSGSGKSTLSKLLLDLYQPTSGSIKIGGVELAEIGTDNLSKEITVVPQESELFSATLLENITLFQKFDAGRFEKAIKVAQLEEVIAKLDQGVDTLVGEKGYRVSGGERQRIAIARAVYKDAQIYIFDEATSNLDTNTEKRVQDLLESELSQKTMIIIAHRTSTIQNCDEIWEFAGGEITETKRKH